MFTYLCRDTNFITVAASDSKINGCVTYPLSILYKDTYKIPIAHHVESALVSSYTTYIPKAKTEIKD